MASYYYGIIDVMQNLYQKLYGEIQAREIPDVYKSKLLQWLNPKQKDKILEIGAGKGKLLDFLREYSPKTLGIEINQEIVLQAKNKHLLVADATHIPLETNSIDKSLSIHTLEHIENLEEVFKELNRITKRNGLSFHAFPSVLLFKAEGAIFQAFRMTYNPIQAWRIANNIHLHKLNPAKINKFIENINFKIIKVDKVFVAKELGFAWLILLQKT